MSDTFRSVSGHGQGETMVRGSRFVAECFHASSQREALAVVEGVVKSRFDATHHCYAYRVGPDGGDFRYSDDREPFGTAGLPILQQVEGMGLTNTVVVVTRYYGGTKLGKGGLARAYADAARAALANSPVAEHVVFRSYRIRFEYSDTSAAMRTIDLADGRVRDSSYGDLTTLHVDVPASRGSEFEGNFSEMLSGRGHLEPMVNE